MRFFHPGSTRPTAGRTAHRWPLRSTVLLLALLGVGAVAAQAAKNRPAAAPAPAAVSARAGLPGGASALTEVHGKWAVNCRVNENDKRCSMVRQERNNDRVLLTLEVQAVVDGSAPAVLLLPFGLSVTQGVTLAVDEHSRTKAESFSTCLPGGCLVPLTLDAAFLQQLEQGAAMTVDATVADQARPITFTVPLEGFSAALARVNALSAD